MKELLKSLELTEDQQKQIMGKLDGNYVPKGRFNEVNTELNQQKEQVTALSGQLEELKKADPEKLQSEIERLQEENKGLQESHSAEIEKMKLDSFVVDYLRNNKAKNPDIVKNSMSEFLKEAKLQEGKVEGLEDALKKIKESDPYLFEEEKSEEDNYNFFGAKPTGKSDPGTGTESIEQDISSILKGL